MSTEVHNSNSQEAAILAQIDTLLDGAGSKDVAKMLSTCYSTGGSMRKRGDEMHILSLKELIESIANLPGDLEERFIDPEVKIYEDIAMVWAKSEVKIDGKLVAVGVNAISLHKIDGEWKITSVSDTARAPA